MNHLVRPIKVGWCLIFLLLSKLQDRKMNWRHANKYCPCSQSLISLIPLYFKYCPETIETWAPQFTLIPRILSCCCKYCNVMCRVRSWEIVWNKWDSWLTAAFGHCMGFVDNNENIELLVLSIITIVRWHFLQWLYSLLNIRTPWHVLSHQYPDKLLRKQRMASPVKTIILYISVYIP